MNSSQVQEPQQSPDSAIRIENIEDSVNDLVKSWKRKQKWNHHFNSQEPADNHSRRKRAPWRIWLQKFLESTYVHILTLLLLLIDLVLTIIDLSSYLLTCKTHKEKKEDVVFHWIGIAILCILTLKILGSVVASGILFFKRAGNVVDGIVVISALCLELIVKKDWAGLLVVVSLWRIIRVVETAFELSNEAIEAKIEGIERQFIELRNENQSLRESIVEKDAEIVELKEELNQLRQRI